ncbi:MAG TPA: erythromycin esterase family protein [Gemmatimonadaceae bacterium]|nr:erythromycin esterase family protein [Gemmatimonadaceae bacterium]
MSDAASALRAAAVPLADGEARHDALIDLIGDARFVLLGEASHGTHEFYAERAAITRRLVRDHGFDAVVVEGDWPDAYRVNRYVRGRGDDHSADAALSGFRRFPQWMWRNGVVVELVEWLRRHNAERATPGDGGAGGVGFYGMDLYSLHTSIESVLRYLDDIDPEAARRARSRYACFEHFGREPQAYGYAAASGVAETCEDAVVRQLVELQRLSANADQADVGDAVAEALFSAEQNARLVANAERYYRSMFRGRVSSWNLRDTHMVDTLEEIVSHLGRDGAPAKVVVWAHNSHLGDARATEMGRGGEVNVGQLTRQRFGADAVRLVGFSTFTGTVTAADDWDEPAQRMRVRESLPGSYERLLHDVGLPAFVLPLRGDGGAVAQARRTLATPRLERAIGVIYRPETERMSHYFHASLPDQFDAVIHLDRTRAVAPLEPATTWAGDEPPETYPSAL